jgi:hypothetical protein
MQANKKQTAHMQNFNKAAENKWKTLEIKKSIQLLRRNSKSDTPTWHHAIACGIKWNAPNCWCVTPGRPNNGMSILSQNKQIWALSL